MGRIQVTAAAIAVIATASLAINIAILMRSGDGSAASSPGSLGAQVGETVSPRGDLKERANLILSTRGERGRIKGQVFLDVFVNDQGKVTVQTRAEVDGLPRGEFGLWLEPPENFQEAGLQPRLLQTGTVRDILELNRDATQFPLSVTELPVTVTTLEGFTLSFRQVQDGIGPANLPGLALLSQTIDRLNRFP